MKYLSQLLNHLKTLLTAPLPVAGLEFSTTSLKYLVVKNQAISQASLRLPPGIIAAGGVKDRGRLVAALKALHAQVAPLKERLTVIINIPSSLVFTQAFSVPLVGAEHLEESIRLNLQMISPSKIEDSYYDYQEIKTNKDLGHIDLLGAFAGQSALEAFTAAATEANFNCVAIEFPSLALARLVRQRWGGLSAEQSYLLIYLSGDGLLLTILKNGQAYFDRFLPWQEIVKNAELNRFDQIRAFFVDEIERVMNFYIGKSGKPLAEAILISPIFNYEIVKIASEELGLKIRNLTITELPKLQPNWFSALGTGLRAASPRSKDTDITLTATSAQTEYYDERTLVFISAWRNIIVGALIFIFASFIVVDTLFLKEEARLDSKIITEFSSENSQNNQIISERISAFNHQLDFIEKVASKEIVWSPLVRDVNVLAGSEITVERLFADNANLRGLIVGRAKSEQAAINFKNRLGEEARLKNVSLPLSNLKIESDKSVTFNLSFEIVKI